MYQVLNRPTSYKKYQYLLSACRTRNSATTCRPGSRTVTPGGSDGIRKDSRADKHVGVTPSTIIIVNLHSTNVFRCTTTPSGSSMYNMHERDAQTAQAYIFSCNSLDFLIFCSFFERPPAFYGHFLLKELVALQNRFYCNCTVNHLKSSHTKQKKTRKRWAYFRFSLFAQMATGPNWKTMSLNIAFTFPWCG